MYVVVVWVLEQLQTRGYTLKQKTHPYQTSQTVGLCVYIKDTYPRLRFCGSPALRFLERNWPLALIMALEILVVGPCLRPAGAPNRPAVAGPSFGTFPLGPHPPPLRTGLTITKLVLRSRGPSKCLAALCGKKQQTTAQLRPA